MLTYIYQCGLLLINNFQVSMEHLLSQLGPLHYILYIFYNLKVDIEVCMTEQN